MKKVKYILAGTMVLVVGLYILLSAAFSWAGEKLSAWEAETNAYLSARVEERQPQSHRVDGKPYQRILFDTEGASFDWEVYPKKPVSIRVHLQDGTTWHVSGVTDPYGWSNFGVRYVELPLAQKIRAIEFMGNHEYHLVFVSRYAERVL